VLSEHSDPDVRNAGGAAPITRELIDYAIREAELVFDSGVHTKHNPRDEDRKIDIPIVVEVDQEDSATWTVKKVVNERTGETLPDIGVYDFHGDEDFPSQIGNGVVGMMEEHDYFEPDTIYFIDVRIRYGGSELGSSLRQYECRKPMSPFKEGAPTCDPKTLKREEVSDFVRESRKDSEKREQERLNPSKEDRAYLDELEKTMDREDQLKSKNNRK